jgi:hypothetical protein
VNDGSLNVAGCKAELYTSPLISCHLCHLIFTQASYLRHPRPILKHPKDHVSSFTATSFLSTLTSQLMTGACAAAEQRKKQTQLRQQTYESA